MPDPPFMITLIVAVVGYFQFTKGMAIRDINRGLRNGWTGEGKVVARRPYRSGVRKELRSTVLAFTFSDGQHMAYEEMPLIHVRELAIGDTVRLSAELGNVDTVKRSDRSDRLAGSIRAVIGLGMILVFVTTDPITVSVVVVAVAATWMTARSKGKTLGADVADWSNHGRLTPVPETGPEQKTGGTRSHADSGPQPESIEPAPVVRPRLEGTTRLLFVGYVVLGAMLGAATGNFVEVTALTVFLAIGIWTYIISLPPLGGTTVEGTVTGHRKNGGDGQRDIVEFTADGQRYSLRANSTFSSKLGSIRPVSHPAGQPERAQLADAKALAFPRLWNGMMALTVASIVAENRSWYAGSMLGLFVLGHGVHRCSRLVAGQRSNTAPASTNYETAEDGFTPATITEARGFFSR